MTNIKTLVKEHNGTTLEARIMKEEHSPFIIDYYINGMYTQTESFPGYSIHFVESAAYNWLEGIKVLNG
jgi:hypothetical protein